MEEKGFFAQLFDFSFAQFITTRMIKWLYGLVMFFTVVIAIASIVSAFSESYGFGVVLLIVAPLWFLLSVIVARVLLEMVIVLFRIAEHVENIAKQGEGDTS